MSATSEAVRGKARGTHDLIKSHPLTPALSAELSAQLQKELGLLVLDSLHRMVVE